MEIFNKIFHWLRPPSNASLPSAADLQEVPSIDGYTITAKHAQGSGSIVYLAKRTESEFCPATTTTYAIKVATDPANSQKLAEESKLVHQLSSQHIVQIFGQGTLDDNRSYQVMEFIEGHDLERLIQRHGSMPDGRVLSLLIKVCDVVAQLHSRGILHGDIKPSNIMLYRSDSCNESIKLIDFGLARMLNCDNQHSANNIASGTTIASGTPHYSAPEIWSQSAVNVLADVYSLACCAYFLLSGKTPFSGNNPLEICSKHLRATPTHLSEFGIAQPLAELVDQGLSKSPSQRPQSVVEFSRALKELKPHRRWTQQDVQRWWDH
jgi:eukaryotic-like serine/threonine-protein kinase